eukprot:tig00000388_g24817.t2
MQPWHHAHRPEQRKSVISEILSKLVEMRPEFERSTRSLSKRLKDAAEGLESDCYFASNTEEMYMAAINRVLADAEKEEGVGRSKRARVHVEPETGGAWPGESASPFGQLPYEVLAHILKRTCISLRNAAAARAVCRRWREAAEEIVWHRLNFSLSPRSAGTLAGILRGEHIQQSTRGDPAAGAARPWIRIAPGASLHLTCRASDTSAASGGGPWDHFLSLVSACTAASGGLSEVNVTFPGSAQRDSGVLGLLRRLVPPGAAACPALRSLALSHSRPADFGELIRPFPNLERLSLPGCWSPRESDAAALASSTPRLKKLDITFPKNADAAGLAFVRALDLKRLRIRAWPTHADGACLGALPSIEFLDFGAYGGKKDPAFRNSLCELIEGIASGPAAFSLEECVKGVPWDLSSSAARALPRLTALQHLRSVPSTVCEEDLAALGSCPALRSLGPLRLADELAGGARRSSSECREQLAGLASALERCPSLVDLQLWFQPYMYKSINPAFPTDSPLPADSLAALAHAGRRRISVRMGLGGEPSNIAGVGAALVAAAPRRIVLEGIVDQAVLTKLTKEGRRGLWADRLAAFHGSSDNIEVNVVVGPGRGTGGCPQLRMRDVQEEAKCALPSARFNFKFTRLSDWR